MTEAALETCLKLLRLPVPAPAPKPTKPQGSFATLHPTQRLANLAPLQLATLLIPPHSLWEVGSVSSGGARLVLLEPKLPMSPTPSLMLRDREWRLRWERRRKPPKGRKRKNPT